MKAGPRRQGGSVPSVASVACSNSRLPPGTEMFPMQPRPRDALRGQKKHLGPLHHEAPLRYRGWKPGSAAVRPRAFNCRHSEPIQTARDGCFALDSGTNTLEALPLLVSRNGLLIKCKMLVKHGFAKHWWLPAAGRQAGYASTSSQLGAGVMKRSLPLSRASCRTTRF